MRHFWPVLGHGVSHSTNLSFLFLLYLNTAILCDATSVWWRRTNTAQASETPAPAVCLCLPDLLSLSLEYTISTQHWNASSQGSGKTHVVMENSNLLNLFLQITLKNIVTNNSDTWSPWSLDLWSMVSAGLNSGALFPCSFCDLGLWAMCFLWNLIRVN